jgi:hypothetical protein
VNEVLMFEKWVVILRRGKYSLVIGGIQLGKKLL